MLAWSGMSLAGGLALPEQSVTYLGTAYAGPGSAAEDASTNFGNAAGLTRLRGEQVVVGGLINLPDTSLKVQSATSAGTGAALGSGTTRPRNNSFIPAFHYSNRINEQWATGVSVVTTFGSKTNYKEQSIARYIATRSEMMTINVGPSLAYRVNEGFSIGGGLDALYVSTVLKSRLNTTGIQADLDGFTQSTASRMGLGYHIGGLQTLSEKTRFGLHYRSKIDVNAQGINQTQLNANAPVTTQNVKGRLIFPESVTLSGHHDLNEKWAVMGDIQWTHWSRFKNLILNFESTPSQLIMLQNYKNSYRTAVGGSYQYDEKWRFKFGGSYEQRSTNDIGRSIYIPDQSQIVSAVGVQYRLTKKMALDLGYAHIFYKKATINTQPPTVVGGPPAAQSLQGTLKHQINAFGLQLTWDL